MSPEAEPQSLAEQTGSAHINILARLLRAGQTKLGRTLVGLSYAMSPVALTGAANELLDSNVPAAVVSGVIGERAADAQEELVSLDPYCDEVSNGVWGMRLTNNSDKELNDKVEMTDGGNQVFWSALGTLMAKNGIDPTKSTRIQRYTAVDNFGQPLPHPEGKTVVYTVTGAYDQNGKAVTITYSNSEKIVCTGETGVPSPSPSLPNSPNIPNDSNGYRLWTAGGDTYFFGDGVAQSKSGALKLNQPIVAGANKPNGYGYWLVASDGGIFSYGDAQFRGSTGATHLNQPIVGMEATPSGNGYWLVARDGGIFAFGDAQFKGSTGDIRLNQPIVGMEATPSGNGYWLVASDGGIFAFGDAKFQGSTGGIKLNQPVVGMDNSNSGNGYWLVARDGGIFAFGDAQFKGSTGDIRLNQPIVGMAATTSGKGYRFVAADGGIFSFGEAPFYGSAAGQNLTKVSPVVGMDSNPIR